jgi:hypothetical protein
MWEYDQHSSWFGYRCHDHGAHFSKFPMVFHDMRPTFIMFE